MEYVFFTLLFLFQPLFWVPVIAIIIVTAKAYYSHKKVKVGEVRYYKNKKNNPFEEPPIVKVKVLKIIGKYVKYQYEWGGNTETSKLLDFNLNFPRKDKSESFKVYKRITEGEKIY